MKRTIIPMLAAIILAVVAIHYSGAAHPVAEEKATKTSFLAHLKPGQPVSLTEKDGRYEIGLYPLTYQPLGHKVIEIGPDYVVLRDLVGITDTIVSVYGIKAIKVLRVGGK